VHARRTTPRDAHAVPRACGARFREHLTRTCDADGVLREVDGSDGVRSGESVCEGDESVRSVRAAEGAVRKPDVCEAVVGEGQFNEASVRVRVRAGVGVRVMAGSGVGVRMNVRVGVMASSPARRLLARESSVRLLDAVTPAASVATSPELRALCERSRARTPLIS
jgi:hypothetical protein